MNKSIPITIRRSTQKGEELEKHLSNVNLEPWYHIYENYVQKDSKEKLNQTEKEEDSSN